LKVWIWYSWGNWSGNADRVLNTLTKKHFQDASKKWQKHRDWCVSSQRDYFEGNGTE
jgi:hypothetical protein